MSKIAALLLMFALMLTTSCGVVPTFQGDFTITQVNNGEAALSGRVVTLAGAPAAGVSVTLQRRSVSGYTYFYVGAVTDEHGVYSFTAQQPITQINTAIYVDYQGFSGEPDNYPLTGSEGNSSGYDFTLHKLVNVSGALVLGDGQTIPPSVRINFNRSGVTQRSVLSDGATGEYTVNLKEAIEYEIAPQQTTNFTFSPAQRSVIPGPDGLSGQDFTLTRLAYSISGFVRYGVDMSPVWGRCVIATGSNGYKAGYTNQQGYYVIEGLAPDTYTVGLENGVSSYVIPITNHDGVNVNFTL